ncbi:hypothetical protein JQ506_22910 [Shinella sp. PSBB067]|uniref:winged helix domain-containing protein n=1 Tax=Shinella sp. PSBB067 TaxID=2715959 RepID=UPI00193B0938|nr:hypothetical protein [Shinella sp. PSBB067]QRI63613.1 hypothetical protein JQ506_22910 [Shinella sp. PSBB067]
MKKLTITARILPDGKPVTVIGRDAWALRNLINAGAVGCTPIDHPGPRWSHYIFKLRGFGFLIETVNENHGGPFAGTHARYVLRSEVEIVRASDQQEAA